MMEFQVDGMSCGGCVRSLTNAVQAVDRSAGVDVDLATKQVRIVSTASLAAITAAIADAGYPVISSAAS